MSDTETLIQDRPYLAVLQHTIAAGHPSPDRTGTGTLRTFGAHMRFDLTQGFPLLTTKRIFFRAVVEELLWFLRGSVNVRELHAKNITIWDEWILPDYTIGHGYGLLWRHWNSTGEEVDQIKNLIDGIKADPNGRRHIVTAWDAGRIKQAALPPCHSFWQVVVIDGRLSIQLHQRSGDLFLGIPFNIASYALLVHILSKLTGHEPGELVVNIADAHIYQNHREQVHTQLSRVPRPSPMLTIAPFERLEDLTSEHFQIHDYNPHPSIPAPVAV